MDPIIALIIFSIIVQAITERVKQLVPEKLRTKLTPWIAFVLGAMLSTGTQIGLVQAIGYTLDPSIIDFILTGAALTGGSAGFNELVKLLQAARGI